MKFTVFSFGFMHGCAEAEYVFDLRFLPNPYWDPALRGCSGDDPKVSGFVLDHAETKEFLALLKPLLTVVCAGRAGNDDPFNKDAELRIAFGCTGGFHRSVAIAEHVAAWLAEQGYPVECAHRDRERTRAWLTERAGEH